MEEEVKGTFKLADLGSLLLNSFKAVLKGEFLLRLNASRYFIHIVYAFVLMAGIIWISLKIDDTTARVEQNKAVLEDLEIVCKQREFELVECCRRSTVEKNLIKMGSELRDCETPLTVMKK